MKGWSDLSGEEIHLFYLPGFKLRTVQPVAQPLYHIAVMLRYCVEFLISHSQNQLVAGEPSALFCDIFVDM